MSASGTQADELGIALLPPLQPTADIAVYVTARSYAGKLEICSSDRDWRRTTHAPCKASPAMIVATITSGPPVPVPSTPRAASSTARLPKTSLRANPSRVHVRIATAKRPQESERSRVGD